MRNLHDVKILRGVAHVVAPRDPAQLLQLSETELPLDGGVGDILVAHVIGGLEDSQAKAGIFAVRNEDRAWGVCARILQSEPGLVELTQQLARNLYAIAENDNRVSNGTLAVLLCEALTADLAPVRFVAILKLDPSAKLRTVADRDLVTGAWQIRYEIDLATLPSKDEKIQKCAFVRAIDPVVDYEMLVVDRQRRTAVVSRFWVTDFLGAEFILDAPERTKRLYRALQAGRNQVETKLDAADLAALDQVISGAVVQTAVNVDELVAALPVPEPIRDQIGTVISAVLPDREFDLDREVARQFVRRRTYRGDNGLRLSILTEFASEIHVDDIEPEEQNTRLRRVWFETRTWQEN
jgi:hypothetical protein